MALFGRRRVVGVVARLSWSRVVQLEQQEWGAKRGSWVPTGDVRNVHRHTEQFWATVTDMQAGTTGPDGTPGAPIPVTRQELQTRTYFTYELLEWHKGRTLTENGTSRSGLKWPEYALETGERVHGTKETYRVIFDAAGKQYETELPEQEWRELEPGGAYELSLGLFGGVKRVAPARL
jgi:hypothetical protein